MGEWNGNSQGTGTEYDTDRNVTATYLEGVEKPANLRQTSSTKQRKTLWV